MIWDCPTARFNWLIFVLLCCGGLQFAAAEDNFIPALAPATNAPASPLTAAEEKATFTLAPGFEIELVAQESEGIGKFVTVDWDLSGRLWTMTALEYPVDANENPAEARALYESEARDKVLVFDRDPKSPTGYAAQPRVFADGLAIPLGILPYKNGVYVQHGSEILYLSDTDGDDKADKREVKLSGFGVQDSHLLPHQFTRAPGNWIWMAQGAFNSGKVRDAGGKEQQFDQTRMAQFHPDGSGFEITSQGPCNIWGLFINGEGEAWIQEANDYGYPAMRFHPYANYPGCSDAQFKTYAPEYPPTAPDFQMGGTGLSGLALSDKSAWPAAYASIMYVANPITRKIQAIRVQQDGPRSRLQLLGDIVRSSDEWFRPVALRLGPDGCLYFVDWYNKIISHNEVPRNHPERDKKRGRIWRLKHKEQKPYSVPDFTKLSGDELLKLIGGPSLTQSHLAWQAIADRQLKGLGPQLKTIVADSSQSAARRIGALWALEGVGAADLSTLKPLIGESNRNLRREAVRAIEGLVSSKTTSTIMAAIASLADDPDPEVRAEVIHAGACILATGEENQIEAIGLLAKLARAPLDAPVTKSTHNGKTIRAGEAYEREFERYLIRYFLEQKPAPVATFLDSSAAPNLPTENRLLLTLALESKDSAQRVARLLPQLGRMPGEEEVLRLAQYPDTPGVTDALGQLLRQSSSCEFVVRTMVKFSGKVAVPKLAPALDVAAREMIKGEDIATRELGARLASAFKLNSVTGDLEMLLARARDVSPSKLSADAFGALKALRELGSSKAELFEQLARNLAEVNQRNEAIAALTASTAADAHVRLLNLWPDLSQVQRRATLSTLAGNKSGAQSILDAIQTGTISKTDLDGSTLDKLKTVLGSTPKLDGLLAELDTILRPVLRLNGKNDSYLATQLTLAGPFTVETWVKLDEGISNLDGILGAPGAFDINFAGAQFRVWTGPVSGDVVIARRKTVAGVWTHYAVTRDDEGIFRVYINGELDATSQQRNTNAFINLDIGRVTPSHGGTAGDLSEYRIWDRARTAQEIRQNFDRSFAGEKSAGLTYWFGGTNWSTLHGGGRVERTEDCPQLLTGTEAKAQEEKFSKFRSLAAKPGDAALGQKLFTVTCAACHNVGGHGGQIGPVLNGAGAMGPEALLRAVLTPNAAMEAGYRTFRVELLDGDIVDGRLISQDNEGIVLGRPNAEDLHLKRANVRRAAFTKTSLMPEGLLESLPTRDVTDLFAYLQTLK